MTDSKNIKIAIVLVTSLFFLWGVSYGLIDVMNKNFQNHLHISVGGKIKCRKRKIKCRIFATNYLSFNLKLKL